jgi:hypothetical protein
MRAAHFFQAQLVSIHEGFHSVLDDMTDGEWIARPFPGMNLPGFTLWHVARTLDMDVQTWIRGVPEVISQERWANCGALTAPGFGYTVTLEEADSIARGVTRADIGAYGDAVVQEVLTWLGTLNDNDLDMIPDGHSHIAAFPVYSNLLEFPNGPIWAELVDPCGLHCRGHLSEVALIKQQVRQAATAALGPPGS